MWQMSQERSPPRPSSERRRRVRRYLVLYEIHLPPEDHHPPATTPSARRTPHRQPSPAAHRPRSKRFTARTYIKLDEIPDTFKLEDNLMAEVQKDREALKIAAEASGLSFQDLSKLDLASLTPLTPEVISRQATINLGTIGHVAHGKSTVVKAISGVKTVRFKVRRKGGRKRDRQTHRQTGSPRGGVRDRARARERGTAIFIFVLHNPCSKIISPLCMSNIERD